ncbi:PREDICTED: mucin-12 [Fragaria vesca subsp. vesca]|uniref:mucin-12 n=1 Tax=Fragaria vesca subsp. vesca TaxID=101020 RepID=UPI0002C377A9|nr:PREDICTED: mucin-12 [Fragaria vesca subsp. vesca]
MPPSPALRCSPGREPRGNHRRGRSFEAGMLVREKDEDLALFNEMQTREKEDFLLQSDDLEDTFSTKLRQFSDFKLGIAIPARGESSDLLNVEEEKNDYEWLLTPPDTPLFPSLDNEPPLVNTTERGRPRSQPISISRSSTMEKSYRSSRGSASPSRLSPSPRSANSTLQSRGRPSSARNSSPNPSLRPASPSRPATPSRSATSSRPGTPSRRPSTPPSKSPSPAPRSSTPTPRRMSTGSSGTVAPPGRRGTSPVTASRGNSASPKIKAWQTNIPGFSSDAPPNLRTSLADRPATYVRGSSPASRSGRGSSPASGYRRQSMSPTASRSVSSSHSHDRDPFSSQSKGSIASSGDDDLDSLQSLPVGSLDRSTPRRVSAFSNNRSVAFSKKSAKLVSASSAPKRSFDSAIRQMDPRKTPTPQNMFRPLLSSVPSSTFYVGKSSSAHRPLISRNSSVTTSSNASSDLGTSVAHDTEGSDHNQDEMGIESEKVPYSDGHDEVFAFDKMDVVNEDMGHDIYDGSHDVRDVEFTRSSTVECVTADSKDSGCPNIVMEVGPTTEASHVRGDFSEINSLEDMELCLKCGCKYYVSNEVERQIRLCPECSRKDKLLSVLILEREVVPEKSPPLYEKNLEEEKPLDEMETVIVVPGSPQVNDQEEPKNSLGEENADQGQITYNERIHNGLEDDSLAMPLVKGGDNGLSEQQESHSLSLGSALPNSDTGFQKSHYSNNYSNMRVDISEGTGISILLKRTSSSKGAAVQGRTFTATAIPYEDLSYARTSSNSMRSSIGHGSFSASSSVDYSPSRQTEARVQRQLSGKKSEKEYNRHETNMKPQSIGLSDLENFRHDTSMKHRRIGSSPHGPPNYSHEVLGLSSDTIDNDFEGTVGNGEYDGAEGTHTTYEEYLPTSDCMEADVTTTSTRTTVVEEDEEIIVRSTRADASTSEISSHTANTLLENNTVAMFPICENSNEYSEDLQNNTRSVTGIEASAIDPESSLLNKENIMQDSRINGVDVEEITNHSSLITVSEIETGKGFHSTSVSISDDASLESKSTMEDFQEPSTPNPSESNLTSSIPETTTTNHTHGILEEESTVMVECQGRSKARSLTLEEATDTILLCSSIVHDLAYQAATIAIEKEQSVPLEGSQPTVTILGKSTPERKESRGRIVSRRSVKSQKGRQKRLETDAGSLASKTENDENENENVDESLQQRPVGLPPNKSDGMKPPKLESKCNCTIM